MSKYRPISIALSPNTERDDILLAKKLLKNPKHWLYGDAAKRLEEKFKEFLPIKYAYAFRSGRSALYAALTALNLKPGEEVLLQAYTCSAVPNAILWTGATPIYVDIDEDSFNMSLEDMAKKITPRTRAIIIQHTFGLPANIKRIALFAKKRNIAVIEDCAHSLGSYYEGAQTGTFGDMAIFSFGRDKVISSVSGGMLVTNNFFTSKKIEGIRSKYKLPSLAWTARHLLHPIIMNQVILPTYGFKNIGKGILEILKTLGISPKVISKVEKEGGKAEGFLGLMPNSLAILALHQLRKLDKMNNHRIQLAKFYAESLKDISKKIELPRLSKMDERDKKHIYLRYTIKTPRAHELIREGRNQNILLGDWYRRAIAPPGVNYENIKYNPEICPTAEMVAAKSVNLPTNINISHSEAVKIVQLIKKFFENK